MRFLPKFSKIPASAPFWLRIFVVGFLIAGIVLIFGTNHFLTQRFTETTRSEGQLTAALYSGNLVSRLERQSLVPLLLARDSVLISDLQSKDYTRTSQRLIELSNEIRAASIDLLDIEGTVVAASERRGLGSNLANQEYFVSALRETGTVFTTTGLADSDAKPGFQYARKVTSNGITLGIVVVHIDLLPLEESWRRRSDKIAVTNSEDIVVLATNPFWRQKSLTSLVGGVSDANALDKITQTERSTAEANPDVMLDGKLHFRSEAKPVFRGWRLTYFSNFDGVRSRVYAYIALEIMVLALLLAGLLYALNKRLQRKARQITQESLQLRQLNTRLSVEIDERRRVERDLQSAEQSLEQASKLAALGQMSAAISHELNQPLAAMKTYLAGARLLLKRDRKDEALSSFHRIDDLIERMGSITRQLKSFARKGSDNPTPVDMRDAVDGSLAMMSPQLRDSRIEIRKVLPVQHVMVSADPVRLDQVIVNLLRNAFDAVENEPDPMIEIMVTEGSQATLTVRDNGTGIESPESLFEPFYTTKAPGVGVGLGLAISAGIAAELGGHLSARNAPTKGAIFELELPCVETQINQAAE